MKAKLKNPLFLTLFIVLVLYLVSLIVPVLWALLLSVKDPFEYTQNVLGLPNPWCFENFVTAFNGFQKQVGDNYVLFLDMFVNSIIYALGGALINVLVICIMAYLSAKFDFFISKIIYGIVIVTMVLPIVGALPSQLKIVQGLGLDDTFIGIFIQKGSFLGMYYLIFYAQFKGISKDYNDAASIDGASYTKTMFSIIFPLVMNTFWVVTLVLFVTNWNDYTTPMIFLENNPTLALGLYDFSYKAINGTAPIQLAGSFLVLIPVLILFLIFKDKMMGNLQAGGIKG